jgi:hypothetical protein
MEEQKQLEKIDEKLEKIDNHLTKIDITLVSQHLSLEEHHKRSTMLEEIVLPIQRKVTLFEGGLKVLGAIVLILSVVAGLADVFIRLFLRR